MFFVSFVLSEAFGAVSRISGHADLDAFVTRIQSGEKCPWAGGVSPDSKDKDSAPFEKGIIIISRGLFPFRNIFYFAPHDAYPSQWSQ